MKQLYLLLFTLFTACLFGCLEEPDMDPSLQKALAPELDKFTMDNVNFTATTIVARATVKKENGDPVTERGFIYWLKNTNEVETKKETNLEHGKGEFKQEIEGLKNDTVYHISPFARNKKGITYGDTLDIKTKAGIGRVITSIVVDVTATSAVVGGTIRNKGEGEIKMIGFNLYKNSELDSIIKIDMDEMPTDSTFIHTLTKLEPETDYVIEAIVENAFGQFNTDKQSFTTPDGHPELGFLSKILIDYTYATVKAKLVKKGDGELDSIGFCWGEEKLSGLPNIKEDSVVKCTVNENGEFIATIPNLKAKTKYIVRGFAVNAFGTVYTSDSLAISAKTNAPTLFMDEPSSYEMKDGYVTVSGVLHDDGRSRVSEIVVCYSSVATPKPGKSEGEVRLTREDIDDDNKFKVSFKLKGGKTYSVVAYATNDFAKEEPSNTVSFVSPNIFTKKADFIGGGRQDFITFSIDNWAFVLGGKVGGDYTNNLFGYSPDGGDNSEGSWAPLASYSSNIYGGSVCSDGNSVYVIGGKSNSGIISDVYSYTYNQWTSHSYMKLTGDIVGTINAMSFISDNSIVVIGGEKTIVGDDRGVLIQDTIYSWDGGNWNGVGDFPQLIKNGISITTGDSVIVGLGYSSEDSVNCDINRKLWLNTSGNWSVWKSLKEAPSGMGYVSTGVLKDSCLYFVDNNGNIWMYNLDNSTWYKCSQSPGIANVPEYKIMKIGETIYILAINNFGKSSFVTYNPTWDIANEQN